jgi:hypothetical protein
VKGVVVVGGRELERAEDAKFRFTPPQHWIWREPRTTRSVSSSSTWYIRRWTTHRYVLSIIIVVWHRYICIYCLSHADIRARRSCRTVHSCAPIPMAAGITPYGTGTGHWHWHWHSSVLLSESPSAGNSGSWADGASLVSLLHVCTIV